MAFFSGFLSALLGSLGGTRVGTDGNDTIVRLFGGRTDGRGGDDTIIGGFFNDRIKGGEGDDLIRARTGNDLLDGGLGNDDLRAGRGNDSLIGGSGDDTLRGGFGADGFYFNPANPEEGADLIQDLNIEAGDKIVLKATDIALAAPNILAASGDGSALEVTDFDPSEDWRIAESASGNTVVIHPGGTIEIEGLAFDSGLTFADLLPALQITGLISGTTGDDRLRGSREDELLQGLDGNDLLRGRGGDDLLFGGAGDDTLRGGRGDDELAGGNGDDELRGGRGADAFLFDPSNPLEGADVIEDLDASEGDRIALNAADIVRASPNVLGASGEGDALEVTDFDPSSDWLLTQSPSGNVVVVHPGGTIEIEGLAFSPTLTYADLLPALELRGLVSGSAGADSLAGAVDDDLVQGLAGDDTLFGLGGNDVVFGGANNDSLYGGSGSDELTGGSGNDSVTGGTGADIFRFDPSNTLEGTDSIQDLNLAEGDQVVLNATDVVNADSDLLEADPTGQDLALDLTDFDAADPLLWDVTSSGDGDLLVVHPGGTIEVEGLPEAAAPSFATLVGAGALGLDGFIDGLDGVDDDLVGGNIDDLLQGRGGDDSLFGAQGEDILIGGSGNDLLIGDADADQFRFDPSNIAEGADEIDDFTLGSDTIVLKLSDILAADPAVEAASGDPTLFEASDLDADPDWDLIASGDGDLTVIHPGGSIELNGIAFDPALTFDALATAGAVVVDA